ncbi:hypothetical protein TNCT_8401 [Trichonephila clavata]|uniref:Uncharacterized protein n=1 Tax=Trichonephila clavata TaxID=2740835 RepID=A0A8X6GUD1_TRICU|nr:hypothetical protein TNCT_8401 [Trichonephila clavata]
MEGRVRVSVLATGIDGRNNKSETSPISQSEDSEKEKFKWPYSHSESTQDKTLKQNQLNSVSYLHDTLTDVSLMLEVNILDKKWCSIIENPKNFVLGVINASLKELK